MDSKEDDKMIKEEEQNNTFSISPTAAARENILSLMDSFIEQITAIRKTLLRVSISALILAPLIRGCRMK